MDDRHVTTRSRRALRREYVTHLWRSGTIIRILEQD